MAEHSIHVSATSYWVRKEAIRQGYRPYELDNYEIAVLRKELQRFEFYGTTKDVLIVDWSKLLKDKRRVGVLLKLLESLTMKGSIWFHGASLLDYPFTIRSRCFIVGSDKDFGMDSVRNVTQYLEEHKAMSYAYEVGRLSGYEIADAVQMAKLKDEFVDLLRHIAVAKLQDFALLYARLVNIEFASHFVHLFIEWLHNNPLFTEKELGVCEFLRSEDLMRSLRINVGSLVDKDGAKHLFLYILCFKLVKQ